MLTIFYAPGACSMAAHIVLEEGGEKYEARRVDLAKGEQKSEAYLKIHPQGRVPALLLDDGTPLTENTAILPFLGKRFGLWPGDAAGETQALSLVGFFASSVHPAHAHIGRPERYIADKGCFPGLQEMGRKSFHDYLKQIDRRLAGRQWLGAQYSVLDAYALVFYLWGVRRELPMAELGNYGALKDRLLQRPGVRRALDDEKVSL